VNAQRSALLAAVLAVFVHLPSLSGAFLYDDVRNIVENRAIRDPTALGAILRFEPARPLLTMTWALNFAATGLRPWSYHLVNILIHAGNAALVASLFSWMARRSGRLHGEASACLGACLFAVTPMAAETVAYVSSRSTGLATLFGLGALRLAVDALAEPRRGRLAAAFGLFGLGLLVKEEAACLPLLLLLLDYFFLAGLETRALRQRWPRHAPFLALPLLGLALRRVVTGAWLPAPAVDPLSYAWTQLTLVPGYLLRCLVPLDPALYRGTSLASWPPSGLALLAAAGTLALLAAAVLGRRRWPELSFATLWLVAGLLPSSSLVALKEMAVDHRAYLAGAGVLYVLGGALWAPGRGVFVAAVLTLLSARSIQCQRLLGDPIQAWEDAVARAPASAEAFRALAEAYAQGGDPRAEEALVRAASLAPGDPRGWANLGAYLLEVRRFEAAEGALRRAVSLAPRDAHLHDNLGFVLQSLNREDEAMAEYEAARSGTPPLAQPRIRLAELALRRGDDDRARVLVEEAARLDVDEQDARAILDLQARLVR